MPKTIFQKHHISYDPEIVVRITKGQHYVMTLLNRMKHNISKDFIKALKVWIALNDGGSK